MYLSNYPRISHKTLLNSQQSGFKTGHSMKTAHFCCWKPMACKKKLHVICSYSFVVGNANKLPQMIQNAAGWLVFNHPKRAHVTPLLIQCLSVAAQTKFKSLTQAYRKLTLLPKLNFTGLRRLSPSTTPYHSV